MGPVTDQAMVYYPYWSHVLLEARIFAVIVVALLALIAGLLWRG